MKNFNKFGGDKRSGGFERRGGSDRPRFGGKPSFNKFGGNDRPVTMHDAQCAQCGDRCQVPFRPNGEKPVFCNNCFGGTNGRDSQPTTFDNRFEKRGAPAFKPRAAERPMESKPDRRIDDLQVQIEALHAKMDKLTELLYEKPEKKTKAATEKTAAEKPAKKVAVKKAAAKKSPSKK